MEVAIGGVFFSYFSLKIDGESRGRGGEYCVGTMLYIGYERARSASEFSVVYWKNLSMSGTARPGPTPRCSLRACISATAGPIHARSSLVGSYIPSALNGTNPEPSG